MIYSRLVRAWFAIFALIAGFSVLALTFTLTFSAPPSAPPDSASTSGPPHRPQRPALNPELFAAHYRAVAAFKADSIPQDYLAVGSARGYVYVLKKKSFGFVNSWNSFYLGAPIKKIAAEDIDGNGAVDLVVMTSAGKMFVFDTGSRQLVWENTSNDFESVSEFLIDQLDPDRARELILCADSRLLVMDGEKLQREYQSADEFKAEYMVICDVDDDDEKEIVLDSGFVINAKTLNIEWQTDFFGTRLTLLDVDNDGVPELICESTGGALKIYDLDIRREKTVF